jgi:hypothetical protein
MDNLKPCPFCGKEVKIQGGPEEWQPTFYDPDSGGDPYQIICECGCSVGWYYDVEDLLKSWNRRANVEK